MLGVWQAVDDVNLVVRIYPGSYAPLPRSASFPQMFVDAVWQDSASRSVRYLLFLNATKTDSNAFPNSLLGKAMETAVSVIDDLVGSEEVFDADNVFNYSNASIGAEWADTGDEDEEYEAEDFFSYTDSASGSFYAYRDEDGSAYLIWMDGYDPHVSGLELRRVMVEAPSAEGVTQGLLRPVIDMANGAEAQTALTVMRWASDSQCMRMDSAALTDSVRTALEALEPDDVQRFMENYAKLSDMMLDALSLNDETWADPERFEPFADAGLMKEAKILESDAESPRSVDLLNAAIVEVMG